MKKKLLAILASVLLLALLTLPAAAEAADTMRVVRCKEWVSLRERPDTRADRLVKVPLGAMVTGCGAEENGFIPCTYGEHSGYILAEYLEAVSPFDLLPEAPTPEEYASAGVEILAFEAAGAQVSVRRAVSGSREVLCAAVFDGGTYRCGLRAECPAQGELPRTFALRGGTAAEPLLIWLDGSGISAYDLSGQLESPRWLQPLTLPGAAGCADADGTLYLIGREEDRLTRVDPDGTVAWRSVHDDPDVREPVRVDVTEEAVTVTYAFDRFDGDMQHLVSYAKEDGAILSVSVQRGGPRAVQLPSAVEAAWLSGPKPVVCLEYAASRTEPLSDVLFTAKEAVRSFQLLRVDTDGELYESTVLYALDSLTPDTPLLITLTFGGAQGNGFAYIDSVGLLHRYLLEVSAEDGSLQLTSF